MLNKNNRSILILACATFMFFGMATAGIGPILPELAEKSGSSYTAIGGVISALFFGALLSNVMAGPICDRIGHKKVMITSLIILSVGLLIFTNMRSLWLIIGFTFFAGLGHGAVDLTTNLLVARVFQEKNVSILNLLHFFFWSRSFHRSGYGEPFPQTGWKRFDRIMGHGWRHVDHCLAVPADRGSSQSAGCSG
jgi:fucose permease